MGRAQKPSLTQVPRLLLLFHAFMYIFVVNTTIHSFLEATNIRSDKIMMLHDFVG